MAGWCWESRDRALAVYGNFLQCLQCEIHNFGKNQTALLHDIIVLRKNRRRKQTNFFQTIDNRNSICDGKLGLLYEKVKVAIIVVWPKSSFGLNNLIHFIQFYFWTSHLKTHLPTLRSLNIKFCFMYVRDVRKKVEGRVST